VIVKLLLQGDERRLVLGDDMTPEVSLSRRCTIPGLRSPPIPRRLSPQWCRSAFTSVPA